MHSVCRSCPTRYERVRMSTFQFSGTGLAGYSAVAPGSFAPGASGVSAMLNAATLDQTDLSGFRNKNDDPRRPPLTGA